MTRNFKEVGLTESSNEPKPLSLQFDYEDVGWLVDSLSLAVATGMCYGRRADVAKPRIKAMLALLEQVTGVVTYCRDGAVWRIQAG